jgi:hypothetical protein
MSTFLGPLKADVNVIGRLIVSVDPSTTADAVFMAIEQFVFERLVSAAIVAAVQRDASSLKSEIVLDARSYRATHELTRATVAAERNHIHAVSRPVAPGGMAYRKVNT